ncbi:MAG: UTP--glucose-1-phosphate uridylyltransferase [Proteobacteria bacterium]|nr:UTP--glucose-1-phosphate uridylyltransferase [Pseudomonadota bacterium]MBU1712062.1 UTP--glucose-1-phosphate uridylyltransferase [Pseudomonadota bacterium]
MKNPDARKHVPSFIEKMEKENLPPVLIDNFVYYYNKVISGDKGIIYDKDIECIRENEIDDAKDLSEYTGAGKKAIKKSIRIVLNGGLGTSMGLSKAKSLIEVRNGKTFLDIIVRQAGKSNVKLAFMNSFNTHEDTVAALKKMNLSAFPVMFLQHKFPKILREGFAPAIWPDNNEMEWNPPGHGDLYTALHTSGTLDKLLSEGIEYAFISNSDNLGATMDEAILGYFAEIGYPFLMEVAERTPSDLKGGHLARHNNGRLILREAVQCPINELDAFRDTSCYRFFNTNNIWINLVYLKDLIKKEGSVHLPLILNPKTLDPRDSDSPRVYQIETAMGAAVSLFDGAAALRVSRSRFFPVKKCNDLLALRSDCYLLTEEEKLIINPERKYSTPRIHLDPDYYGKIDHFNERFKEGPVSLVECEFLQIIGDVYFEKNVKITGNVVISNRGRSRAVIKKGSEIEGDINF